MSKKSLVKKPVPLVLPEWPFFSSGAHGDLEVVAEYYQMGGGICLQLLTAEANPIPVATLSINLLEDNHLLGQGEFFIKTWDENEEIVHEARESGLFVDTGKRRRFGRTAAEVWKFKENT
jgi:hypothetical protein